MLCFLGEFYFLFSFCVLAVSLDSLSFADGSMLSRPYLFTVIIIMPSLAICYAAFNVCHMMGALWYQNSSLTMSIATNKKNVVVVVADDRTGTLLAVDSGNAKR